MAMVETTRRVDDVSRTESPLGLPNTEISCEDRAILAFAGFVSFISLLDGAISRATRVRGTAN